MLSKELDPEAVEERLKNLPKRLQIISEARLIELLEEAGFEQPVRFFQMAIYGGWVVQKK